MKMAPKGVALMGGTRVVTVEVGFEVLYAQAKPSETAHFLLPLGQDIESQHLLQHLMCLHPTMSHHEDNRLSL